MFVVTVVLLVLVVLVVLVLLVLVHEVPREWMETYANDYDCACAWRKWSPSIP